MPKLELFIVNAIDQTLNFNNHQFIKEITKISLKQGLYY